VFVVGVGVERRADGDFCCEVRERMGWRDKKGIEVRQTVLMSFDGGATL